MGWRARSEPSADSGQEMMHWLVQTYEVAGAQPEPAALVRVSPASEPSHQPDAEAAPRGSVAVLDRPVEPVPDAPTVVPEATEPVPDDPAPALFAERRLERRVECALAVAAAPPGDIAETAMGEAVDISLSGVHVLMDKVAAVGPVDLIVADVVVDARVVGYQKRSDGRHSWHVRVVDPDDAWLGLVRAQ